MLEPDWRVDRLTLDDCDELGRVHVRVWRESYADDMPADYLAGLSAERFAASWRRRVEQPGADGRAGWTLVARSGRTGAIVGFASAGPSRDVDPPAERELYAVNLLAEVHGTGLADVLLDRVLGDLPVTLWVVENNARARAFYTRRGFVDEGGRKQHEATGTPEMRMIRRRPACVS